MHDALVTLILCEEVEKNCGFERTRREISRSNWALLWLSI